MAQFDFSIALRHDLNDDNENVFKIKNSETKLGRGHLFAISDKRVSRNHAVLLIQTDQLCLKSIHSNPCFLNLKKKNKKIILKQGDSMILEDGDQFSLLQDKYFFVVKIDKHCRNMQDSSNDLSTFNSEVKSQDIKLLSSDNSSTDQIQNNHYKFLKHNHNCSSLDENEEKPMKSLSGCQRPMPVLKEVPTTDEKNICKKRKLPNWMSSGCFVSNKLSAVNLNKTTNEQVSDNAKDVDVISTNIIGSSNKLLDSSITASCKKNKSIDKTKHNVTSSSTNNGSNEFLLMNKPSSVLLDGTDSSQNDKLKEENEVFNKNKVDDNYMEKDNHNSYKNSAHNLTLDVNADDSLDQNNKREPCAFGKDCYRKNSVHFNEFSHPGDDDYYSIESNSDESNEDNRPECEYGLQCYRKNPFHRKQFKHSCRKNPKRKLANKNLKNDFSGEYDNSFIDEDDDDDDDESLSDESDWTPSNVKQSKESSGGSAEEDIDDLINDAKTFSKNKKLWKK